MYLTRKYIPALPYPIWFPKLFLWIQVNQFSLKRRHIIKNKNFSLISFFDGFLVVAAVFWLNKHCEYKNSKETGRCWQKLILSINSKIGSLIFKKNHQSFLFLPLPTWIFYPSHFLNFKNFQSTFSTEFEQFIEIQRAVSLLVNES